MNNKIAVQLYTLHGECEKDFYGTLEKVAELGFNGVELAGYWGKDAKDLKATLDRLGLKAVSSHVPLEKMEENLEGELEYLKVLDCANIVIPYLVEERRSDYAGLVKRLNEIGEKSQKDGISLSYHNHDFELEKNNGKSHLEFLFEETNPKFVKAELDVYWLTLAGEDPLEWMDKYSDRMSLIHLKDMTTDSERTFAELGTGGVNIEGVLRKSKETQIQWFVVEQDRSKRSPFESIEISMNYLKETLPKIE
ncbi:sugar phosphate isomerase/epimerase family protein [Metabacillus sp. Hm71]|uniref:sugar phosphate isomerase/epimerase family protein n=1 Tax=Metabacillus sp. Hm71 TaxID=3450743 RepID=UPI003F42793D